MYKLKYLNVKYEIYTIQMWMNTIKYVYLIQNNILENFDYVNE